MSFRIFRATATCLTAMALTLGAATVPASGVELSGPTLTTSSESRVSGCGVQNALPLLETPLTTRTTRGVTLNADGSRLYLSQAGTGESTGTITVFDTQTLEKVAETQLPGYHGYADQLALNPTETKGYMPTNAYTVEVFDTSSNRFTATIPVYVTPQEVEFSPDGAKAYVLHQSGAITVIDTQSDAILGVWHYHAEYGNFSSLEIDPTGAYGYIGGASSWAVLTVDLESGSIIGEIPLEGPAGNLTLTRDGGTLYVMDRYHQRTLVVNMTSRSITGDFPVAGETLVLSRSENRAFIARPESQSVGVIDLTTNALICSHWLLPPNAKTPLDIALSPASDRLYIGGNSLVAGSVMALDVPQERNPTFTDVPPGTAYHREISWLAAAEITTGFSDQTFRPLEHIRRDAMAAFLYRFHGSPEFVPPAVSPFTDVSPRDKFYKEITWLASMGITQGWPHGSYRPLQPVNRDAMAAFLYRTVDHARFRPPATSPFEDVKVNDPFYLEMTFLSATGVATGWPDGTYRPLQPVNRDAMAAFLFRLNPMAADLLR